MSWPTSEKVVIRARARLGEEWSKGQLSSYITERKPVGIES